MHCIYTIVAKINNHLFVIGREGGYIASYNLIHKLPQTHSQIFSVACRKVGREHGDQVSI